MIIGVELNKQSQNQNKIEGVLFGFDFGEMDVYDVTLTYSS